jgi:uncharacterized membrane protein YiaA
MVAAAGHASGGHSSAHSTSHATAHTSVAEHVTATHTSEAHPIQTPGYYLAVTHGSTSGSSGQVGTVEEKKEDPPTVSEDYARQGAVILGLSVLLVILVVASIEFARRAGGRR